MQSVTADGLAEDPEEGEEGELADAPQASAEGIKAVEVDEAMDIDGQGDPLWLVCRLQVACLGCTS